MAISWVKSQVFRGSFAQRGVRHIKDSIVKRVGILQGLEDTISSYRSALNFAQTHWATFDPIEGLPRQTITVEKLSSTTARVVAFYALTSGLDIGNTKAMERADVIPSISDIPWYSTHKSYKKKNYEDGGSTSWFNEGSKKLVHHPVDTWRFLVSMSYGSSPLTSSIRSMRNTINKKSFSLGGILWPQFAVHFDAPEIKVRRVGSYTLFTTTWSFNVREEGWWKERHAKGSTVIERDLMYDDVNFSVPITWIP